MFFSSKNHLTALLALTLALSSTESTRIVITNNCSYTVWAAAKPGGGKLLHPGYTWTLPSVTRGRGRIWGRTDCGGVLECSSGGRPPNTVVKYTIDDAETDTFSVSVTEGFNVPIQFGAAESAAAVCNESARCVADVSAACPTELRDPEGCNSPCTVFQNRQFCCGGEGEDECGPTSYSEFFEGLCPEAVTYPLDVAGKTRQCQTGIDYSAVFCPSEGRALPEYNPEHNPVFDIRNNCPFTVWAAAVPGGGRRLDGGQSWSINVNPGTTQARIWARTGCNFNRAGRGGCQTGDCGGVLECQGFGQPPCTLAEYALNQFNNMDFFDISLVDGFNVPMEFSPTSGGCRSISCTADINGQCPNELKAPGGCNNPCTVFKTNEYCCTNGSVSCEPTTFSTFFKDRCPDAYSYPQDDPTSTFTCPGGTNYRVVFCP